MSTYCPKCGVQFSPSDRFCGSCGAPITAADATPESGAANASAPAVGSPAGPAGVDALIPKAEFNTQRLLQVYQSAFMEPTLDASGQVRIVLNGVIVLARASEVPGQPFLILAAMFAAKPDAPRLQKLELCNRLNDKMVMVRCCIPDVNQGTLWIDHYTITEGGITGEEIVAATRRFATVIVDGARLQDTEHILK